nr:MAG TPA: tail protein [Caudoviricetes sp.]
MGGKSSTISTSEQRILSLQVQQSSQGLTLPVVYGRARVAGNLVWYGDFTTYEHKTTTRQGGKGGGGVKQVDVKYTYEAAVMMALCEGEIKGVTRIWRDKEKFSSPASLRLTLYKGGEEQPVWPHLQQAKHAAQAISYSGTAYLCSPNYELTKSAQIYSHNFEVDGKLGYSTSIVDANPRDIIRDLLTNQKYGCGFSVENLGDTDVYGTYCRAAGIFLSPVYSEQQEAQRNIAELLEQTNSAAVFSQGRLKIVPYGDSGLSGNGATYIPNLTPLYDLTDDDFIVSGAEDPVRVERKTNADAYNQVQIEYLDRANDYNIAVAEAKDQANIEQYGIRPKDAVKMHGICDAKVARQVAQLLLQRALYVRNEYEFKLGWKYCLLEPMDLVTLTDGGLGLDKTPVRITEIEEDEDGVLNVKAEDFPFGTASATEYPTQPSLGYSADYNVSPGNAHAPVMFEAPLQLTGGEPEIWLATAGGDMWGGAEVWVSTNGDSYTRVGAVSGKARYGSLTAALPAGAVFDRANTLGVEIGAGQLTGGTEQDSRDLLTLCYADGEFLAYETAELKGVGRYTLGNLTRGAYGSNIDRHEAGRPFVRVDESLFKYPVPRDWIGRTVWVKLVSHNVFGSGAQDLAEVPAYSYRIIGAPLGQVANLRLTSSWAYGREAVLAWDKLDGADTYDVEIYAAGSQTRLRAINGITANGYTYTLADMKADGGQVRNVVFKVRGRAVTGKTGAWAQVVAQNPQLKALTGIQIDSGLRQAFFQCERPSEEDFAGIILWVSDNPACPTVDANRVYDGAETFVTIAKCNGNPLEGGKTYYVRAAGYDSFDKTGLQVSSSAAFTVYDVDVTVRDLAESSLNKALRDKIALIDGSGAGSVNARIQTAFRKAADDLTAKARELGTKITAEEAVNTEQARQIQAVTAAQGNTAAGLEAEKRARAEGDRAEAQARETLVGRVASAEGSINTLRETVARSDGARAEEIRQLQAKFTIPDTRNDNRPPSWYYANHPRSTVSEFKQADVLGLGSGFAALETVVPWGDPSGGRIFQTAYLQDGTVQRRKSDTAHTYAGGVYNYTKDQWTGWAADETADGAQAKADAVRRVAEAAQAAANRVDADFRQFASTQAGKDGATAQRISELSASIGNLQIGGRNLLRGSDSAYQGGDYGLSYGLADVPNVGEAVTLTVWGEVAADRTVGVYNTFGNRELARLAKVKDGVYRVTFDWNAPITGGREQPNVSSKNLALFFYRRESTTVSRIDRIKLERGTVGTDWSPAPEDEATHREAALTAVTQTVERAVTKAEGDIRAVTERITTLQTSVNGNTASIQTHARSINGLEAQYTVKVDVNGRVAGYGLATTPKNGTPESKFIVTADRFGVGSTGKADVFPFTVDTQKNRVGVNGELVVNGKAIIDNLNAGTIHGDKIAANTLNANRIRAGSVTAREIASNAVTADKINVTSLSAISADMGAIRAGSLNLGNGRFTVDNNGRVSISAASGNVGLKMTNDKIQFFNERGVLIVELSM